MRIDLIFCDRWQRELWKMLENKRAIRGQRALNPDRISNCRSSHAYSIPRFRQNQASKETRESLRRFIQSSAHSTSLTDTFTTLLHSSITMGLLDTIKDAFSSHTETSSSSTTDHAPVPELPEKAVFDAPNVTVIFVLGGPGAGTPIDSSLY